MRTLSPRATVAVLVLLLTTACNPAPEPPQPVQFTVGLHNISLMEPEGWEHLDHGLEHRFHKELNSISVADIGPVTGDGYIREMNHALALFREERLEDASAHISSLPLRKVHVRPPSVVLPRIPPSMLWPPPTIHPLRGSRKNTSRNSARVPSSSTTQRSAGSGGCSAQPTRINREMATMMAAGNFITRLYAWTWFRL
ncbi:MAG: hypothetical protein IFK94_10540 [Acidobacteria bacterium]|uniref:Uncharacterized protein n=1 Tax=Candidatus Polarisedimenticola svalbardensis TaxID=2886004 RepID=A0A8J7CEQ8_9BACT|nr:hypothetical protein [Candidatus Polarisedimenticola svalbardensis]